MDSNKKNIKPLKNIIIYPTIGIIFFSITFIANKYVDINLFGNRIDIRYTGIIFLACMIGYAMPSLIKLQKMNDVLDE